ncbi:MAG: hypothetical protein ACRENX_13025 [Candidatus Dormibacteria bacterium]
MSRPRSDRAAIKTSSSSWFCSPPRLPGNSAGKRLADRLLPTGIGQCVFFAAVIIGLGIDVPIPVRAIFALHAVATLAAGAWCLVNFWRCREAHCVVNGIGWSGLGLLILVEVALGRSLIGGFEEAAFLGVLAAAIGFEVLWRARYGTNAVLTMS